MSQPSIDHALSIAIGHLSTGQFAPAEEIYRQILAQQPDQPDALCMLGAIAIQKGQPESALDYLQRAVANRPNFADAYYHLGNACKKLKQLREAVAAFQQAIAARPNFPEAYFSLGLTQVDQDQPMEAIASFEQAISLRPAFPEAHNNLAAALKDTDQFDRAMLACRNAIALRPGFPEAHYNLSQIQLLLGDFAAGWVEYESRWVCNSAITPNIPRPLWDGSDLSNRTIFLHDEQGLGDTIQFIRYVPMVAARGAKVIVGCPAVLRRILQSVKGVDHWVGPGEAVPRFDFHCPLLSLPRVFATSLESIPGDVPYLQPDAADVEKWQKRMADHPNDLKIGLVWSGNPNHKKDRQRSMPLAAMAALAEVKGLRFYSLQMGDAARQLASPPAGLELSDLTQNLNDFADTAAMIANLDLVISVDTAVVHLAGAMAKPVWTLLPFSPDWRWLLNREDSPWYPTLRLFRQPAIGDWHSVVQRVKSELKKLVGQ